MANMRRVIWLHINIPGLKQAKVTLEPGDLEGGFGGDIIEYWGLRTQYSIICPPESPLKIARFQCLPLACFKPSILIRSRMYISILVPLKIPGPSGGQPMPPKRRKSA